MGRWHEGMDCDAYRAGAADVSDAHVLQMAEDQRWKRCPSCRSVVFYPHVYIYTDTCTVRTFRMKLRDSRTLTSNCFGI